MGRRRRISGARRRAIGHTHGAMAVITALLGPTNTGKTHRAVTTMLEHRTGMIGLPLRLLAREVYDRVSAAVGEAAVALVTGEEKRALEILRTKRCSGSALSMPITES